MTATVVVEGRNALSLGGVETWCDECWSVAWFPIDPDGLDNVEALRKAAAAAQLHEGNDCAPIFLDDAGEPTTITTSTYAGGSAHLLEYAQECDRLAAVVGS